MEPRYHVTLKEEIMNSKWRTRNFKNTAVNFIRRGNLSDLNIGKTKPVALQVTRNIEKIFTRFLDDKGFVTISFKEPKLLCMIRACDSSPFGKSGLQRIVSLVKKFDGEYLDSNKKIAAQSRPIEILKKDESCIMTDYTEKLSILRRISRSLRIGSLEKFANTSVLELTDCKLKDLPDEIGLLKLTQLNLSNNRLGEGSLHWRWTSGIIRRTLGTLSLKNNSLNRLPCEVQRCQNLTRLDVSMNNLKQVAHAIVDPKKRLQILNLDCNPDFKFLPLSSHRTITQLSLSGYEPPMASEFPEKRKLFSKSLLFIAATAVLKWRIDYIGRLPRSLEDLLDHYRCCSKCLRSVFHVTETFRMESILKFASSYEANRRDLMACIVICEKCQRR